MNPTTAQRELVSSTSTPGVPKYKVNNNNQLESQWWMVLIICVLDQSKYLEAASS